MRPELERDFIIKNMDIGMMPFFFGDIGDFAYEIHGPEKIFEGELAGYFFLVFRQLPMMHFVHVVGKLFSGERRSRLLLARYAFFLVKRGIH